MNQKQKSINEIVSAQKLETVKQDDLALDCIVDEFVEDEKSPQNDDYNPYILYQESRYYNPFAKEESNVA